MRTRTGVGIIRARAGTHVHARAYAEQQSKLSIQGLGDRIHAIGVRQLRRRSRIAIRGTSPATSLTKILALRRREPQRTDAAGVALIF